MSSKVQETTQLKFIVVFIQCKSSQHLVYDLPLMSLYVFVIIAPGARKPRIFIIVKKLVDDQVGMIFMSNLIN